MGSARTHSFSVVNDHSERKAFRLLVWQFLGSKVIAVWPSSRESHTAKLLEAVSPWRPLFLLWGCPDKRGAKSCEKAPAKLPVAIKSQAVDDFLDVRNCWLKVTSLVLGLKNPALFLDQFERRLPAHILAPLDSTYGFAHPNC